MTKTEHIIFSDKRLQFSDILSIHIVKQRVVEIVSHFGHEARRQGIFSTIIQRGKVIASFVASITGVWDPTLYIRPFFRSSIKYSRRPLHLIVNLHFLLRLIQYNYNIRSFRKLWAINVMLYEDKKQSLRQKFSLMTKYLFKVWSKKSNIVIENLEELGKTTTLEE